MMQREEMNLTELNTFKGRKKKITPKKPIFMEN